MNKHMLGNGFARLPESWEVVGDGTRHPKVGQTVRMKTAPLTVGSDWCMVGDWNGIPYYHTRPTIDITLIDEGSVTRHATWQWEIVQD